MFVCVTLLAVCDLACSCAFLTPRWVARCVSQAVFYTNRWILNVLLNPEMRLHIGERQVKDAFTKAIKMLVEVCPSWFLRPGPCPSLFCL